jgi:pimeloyl-ACP methyl ester carboxylesterase
MSTTDFEKQRLKLFAVNGFEGRGTRIVDPDGRMTYAVTRGAGEVPTILIHGGLSNAGEWALCAGGFEGWVIVPDRPGCGLSDPIDYLATDYRAEAVDWMLSLTDALGVDQVDLVGNSMGGYFSIVFALAHPERVRRMVLVGAPAGLHRHVPAFLRLWGTPGIGRLISASPPRDTERIRQQVFGRMLVARPDDLTTEFLQMMANSLALPGAARASYTMLRTVLNLAGWRSRLRLVPGAVSLGRRRRLCPALGGGDPQTADAGRTTGDHRTSRAPSSCRCGHRCGPMVDRIPASRPRRSDPCRRRGPR